MTGSRVAVRRLRKTLPIEVNVLLHATLSQR